MSLRPITYLTLDDLSKNEAMIFTNPSFKLLNIKLKDMISFCNKHYPRIMITARTYFKIALELRDIKHFSNEYVQLSEGTQRIISDIHEYDEMQHQFSGLSRRKLAFSIEIFMIVVLRTCYAFSLLNS